MGAWQPRSLRTCLGMTRQEFILRFTFTHPELDTTIVGTSTRRIYERT